LLITAVALECGYPASSIRERIYISAGLGTAVPAVGILIYTASAGNIFGFWRDQKTGREYYGEHKEYKVSFSGRNRVAMLQKFLSQLAGELNEDCIYLEYGEDAWLVYAHQI